MLSRTLEGDILRGYAEIQGRVDSRHAQNERLSTECSALAEKAKGLEARVVELEEERRDQQEEVKGSDWLTCRRPHRQDRRLLRLDDGNGK